MPTIKSTRCTKKIQFILIFSSIYHHPYAFQIDWNHTISNFFGVFKTLIWTELGESIFVWQHCVSEALVAEVDDFRQASLKNIIVVLLCRGGSLGDCKINVCNRLILQKRKRFLERVYKKSIKIRVYKKPIKVEKNVCGVSDDG